MKAEISASGKLVISAESALESYALRKWCDRNKPWTSSNMLIAHGDAKNFPTRSGDCTLIEDDFAADREG